MVTTSKTRVAGKACHLVGGCLALFLAVNAVGALYGLLSLQANRSMPGLTFVAEFFASVLTLAVALVALLLLTMLEGVAFAAGHRDTASAEERRHEWRLAVLWAALPGLALLSLTVANAWWGW